MFNRFISLLSITTLYAAPILAEEPNTIYIPSDNIVPYQASKHNITPPPQDTVLTNNRAPIRIETPTVNHNEPAPGVAPAATYDNLAPATAAPTAISPEPAALVIEAPTQTHLWLKLQSSGAIAGTRYKTNGQTATQIYQRYLKSFTHPIPEHFKQSSGGSGSGSSSSSFR